MARSAMVNPFRTEGYSFMSTPIRLLAATLRCGLWAGGPPSSFFIRDDTEGAPSFAEKRGVGFCASQQKVGLQGCRPDVQLRRPEPADLGAECRDRLQPDDPQLEPDQILGE